MARAVVLPVAVAQKNVEMVIGRLVTDEGFRQRFAAAREETLDAAAACGLVLTPTERRALLEVDVDACASFAQRLDPRLQKICLRRIP